MEWIYGSKDEFLLGGDSLSVSPSKLLTLLMDETEIYYILQFEGTEQIRSRTEYE